MSSLSNPGRIEIVPVLSFNSRGSPEPSNSPVAIKTNQTEFPKFALCRWCQTKLACSFCLIKIDDYTGYRCDYIWEMSINKKKYILLPCKWFISSETKFIK